MIELRKITDENFEECIGLDLTQAQWQYLANNAYSLSEAYALQNDGNKIPMPYVIYHNDVMVGFTMAVYRPIDQNDPGDDENNFYISRLMIDQRYQGNGYGKQALVKFIEIMKTLPYGEADSIILSCAKENTIAYRLYESLGFVDTGEIDEDGDCYMRLNLKP
ncbi:GNAT family N-acetyltransferase [Lederbergia sp. NSJ-179]|uniref:GNAT family N-acetyltransferase n=1 Tax=Lederbergia sp. NSJ-179 TaxID=2931402 RepID=UPI001FD1114D|nr:GNAT family N-acetyltransferase [Lederbergia sp. NSJ-179]MCJ7841490.1 GNAT family N-acetyltransferase [Lederbergia sp. NSJ-179]